MQLNSIRQSINKVNRKRKKSVLDVYVGVTKVGTYSYEASGTTSFRYEQAWISSDLAFPISLSIPLSNRVYSGESAANFFDGLLPDDRIVREKIASREHARSAGIFDLLSVIGRDCVGALRFIPEGDDPGDPAKMAYRPVSEDEIAMRIASLENNPLGMQSDDDDFRISIAGVQEKTAFLYINDRWQLPLGATPTSHIFKPAMRERPSGADLSDSPWNEWVCLALCNNFGLETAKAEIKIINGLPVIVVERFDRLWQGGVLYRVPQEDLCQALGYPPFQKYQSDGGPGILSILKLLTNAVAPHEDRLKYFKAQIVFWLLAAIDGHAKNFSIFLTQSGYSLAPLYNVMSAAPYHPKLSSHKVKLAMAMGDDQHYRVKEILPRHIYQTGKKSGFADDDIDHIFSDLTGQMGKVLASVAIQAAKAGVPVTTSEPIIEGVSKRAKLIKSI